jgi:hypothetical protein
MDAFTALICAIVAIYAGVMYKWNVFAGAALLAMIFSLFRIAQTIKDSNKDSNKCNSWKDRL